MPLTLPTMQITVTASDLELQWRLRNALLDAALATTRAWLAEQPRDPAEIDLTATADDATGTLTLELHDPCR